MSYSAYPNYLWVNLPVTVVGAAPNFAVGPYRESDCFDILTIAITCTGNTSLATVVLSINWYNDVGRLLFVDTLSGATATKVFSQTVAVKGANCSITVNGAVDSGFSVQGTAILGVYRG